MSAAPPPKVRIAADRAELAALAAEEYAAAAESAVAARGRFAVALAGGSTPRDLYRTLAGEPFLSRLPWDRSHFFWGDERHVPPDHPDSNFRMAREALLDAVPVPPGNVHRIPAEDPEAERAARAYEATLARELGLAPGGLPRFDLVRFDLVLLGLGEDGHTASLFPGTGTVEVRDRLAIAPWIEELGAFRITLTVPVFHQARRVLFLVSGERKARALRAVLQGDEPADRLPAKAIRPGDGDLLWLVDRAAASLLQS